jgi:hypothetical protein
LKITRCPYCIAEIPANAVLETCGNCGAQLANRSAALSRNWTLKIFALGMLMAVIAVGLLVSNPVFGWDLFTFGRKPIDWQRANSGILIERVLQGSPAEQIGLHVGDVIVGYNGTRVTDDHSIDAARSRALRQLFPSEVVLTVYPDGQCTPVKIKAPKGRLGIETNEWTYAGTFAYDALITKGNQQLAEQYVSDAERSGEYDENQMLHMKVMVVPNGTGAEESARRESIVEELPNIPRQSWHSLPAKNYNTRSATRQPLPCLNAILRLSRKM